MFGFLFMYITFYADISDIYYQPRVIELSKESFHFSQCVSSTYLKRSNNDKL